VRISSYVVAVKRGDFIGLLSSREHLLPLLAWVL
jgi:hypothetical protein